MFEIVGNCLVGKIAQAVVVAIVADLGGKFRLGAQRVLPFVGEQAIEFGSSGFECLLGCLGEERDDESRGDRNNHERCLQEQTSTMLMFTRIRRQKISEKRGRRFARGEDVSMSNVNGADAEQIGSANLSASRHTDVQSDAES